MLNTKDEFVVLILPVLLRVFAQTMRAVLAPEILEVFARRLWALVEERGLPAPLAPCEQGEAQEMTAEEVALLIERLLAGLAPAEREALATPARQLVKACFNAPFKTCRDSFREVSPDGSCRRQELTRARERVSGAHCVDCPYWTALTPPQHAKFLAREWRVGGPAEFVRHQDVFLPEDFRALREFLQTQALRDRS